VQCRIASVNVQGGHSPGKVGEFQSGQGKVGEMEKVRETEICLLHFERAEELKLQLLGLDFGYVHH